MEWEVLSQMDDDESSQLEIPSPSGMSTSLKEETRVQFIFILTI
jgi:hypothetical protein